MLDGITRNPLFLTSDALVSFLRDDRSIFESVLKTEEKKRKPDRVENMWSISGSLQCQSAISPSRPLSDYLSLGESLKRKISQQFTVLQSSLLTLSSQLSGIAESFQLLANLQDIVPEAQAQKSIAKGLGSVFSTWAKQESEVAELTLQYGEFFHKEESEEMAELGEMLRKRDMLAEAAARYRERLAEKKEKLWTLGDTGKWELAADMRQELSVMLSDKSLALQYILPVETKELERQQHYYAFHNYQLKAQLASVLTNSARYGSLQLSEFSRLLDETHQVICLDLRDFQGRLSAYY